MSVFLLPTRSDLPHFDFFTELDGTKYGLEFKWNEREESWYMSILDSEGTAILSGRKVVVNWPLFSRFAVAGLPPGNIIALDTAGTETNPGLTDLGDRVQIYYFDSDEPTEEA